MPDIRPFATAETANLVNGSAANQKQLLRLQLAAQILSGLVVGQDILWTHDPDACGTHEEVVDTAVKYADLLLKKITQTVA